MGDLENNGNKMRVAAIQLEPVIGDVRHNLLVCEKLANEAGEKGAQWIILPEFFTTGMAFNERIKNAVLPYDGEATKLLLKLAKRYQAYVGGSFLCRDQDGHVRNAFLLASPDRIVGRHDKDLPTMWENCFYIGGNDEGLIKVSEMTVGSVLCWEFMRSQTARRLREKIDIVVGGSCWWSVPKWYPKTITNKWENANSQTAIESVRTFATYVGAPVIHASHCGNIDCKLPWLPVRYRGYYEGGAMVVDAQGKILAMRKREDGPGVVVADVIFGKIPPQKDVPDRFWLHKRGPLPSFAWTYQRLHGRMWYKKHMLGKNPNHL